MPSVRPFALLVAVPALLVGCSAAAAPASAPPPPAITANPTPVSTDATAAPPATTTAPAAACPSGDYRATSVALAAPGASPGKGTVTDVDVTFRNGRYVFDFDDDHPVTVTIDKRSTRVRVDGEIRGSYTGTPDALTFDVTGTEGSARFTQDGRNRSLTMQRVADLVAPQGKGSAVCNGDDLTLSAGTLTWELVRDLD